VLVRDGVHCTAVGFALRKQQGTLAEHFSGSAWSSQGVPTPTGAQTSDLSGVSCPTLSNCMDVGNFTDGSGTGTPLGVQYS
jgi:hypothetical protein